MNRPDCRALVVGIGQTRLARSYARGRAWLCAKICAGEQESAIRDLLSFYANSEAELPRELAPPMRAWIPRLRRKRE